VSSQALKAVATGQVARTPRTIFDYLDDKRVRDGLTAVAGKFLTADRMLKLCINAVKKTPLLMKCDPQTVLGAMMTSAALGLEPNTIQQQAFLIPYKKRVKVGNEWIDAYECQFQVGARGFVTLAYRSPYIKSLAAEAIHDGDVFEHELGSETFLRYAKTLRSRGPLIGAFSHVVLKEGGESACVLPLDEILKIRERSETFRALRRAIDTAESAKDKARAEEKFAETPWVMWEDDMATKSAIKKHAKLLPIASSDALLAAADIDNRGEAGGSIDLKALADPDAVRAVVGDGMEAPALEHQEAETPEFPAEQREAEAVGAAAAPAQQQASAPPPARRASSAPAAKQQAGEAKPRDLAHYTQKMENAVDASMGELVLDDAREDLGAEDLGKLNALYEKRFGGK
jgi:recombination protein RecT